MATKAVDEVKEASVMRIAAVLKGATLATQVDEGKISELKKQRDEEKKLLKTTSKQIKLETRKKQRLMKKAACLPTNDLLECARIRFEKAESRAAAKKVRTEKGLAKEPAAEHDDTD